MIGRQINYLKDLHIKKTNLPIHPTSLTTEDGTIKDTIVLGKCWNIQNR